MARPYDPPYPQQDIILNQAVIIMSKAATPVLLSGHVHGLLNRDSLLPYGVRGYTYHTLGEVTFSRQMGQKNLILRGGNTGVFNGRLEQNAAEAVLGLTPTRQVGIGFLCDDPITQATTTTVLGDPVPGDEDAEEVTTTVLAYDGNSDQAWIEFAFSLAKNTDKTRFASLQVHDAITDVWGEIYLEGWSTQARMIRGYAGVYIQPLVRAWATEGNYRFRVVSGDIITHPVHDTLLATWMAATA